MPTSEDFLNKYSAQASANEGALGYVTSTPDFLASNVAAFGVNLWNSLIALPSIIGIDLDGMKADTYDTIKAVNDNWAEYYDRNRSTIETTSFIGGLLLPMGLAIKGMKILQAGKFGLYPEILGDASQVARRGELVTMLENGGKATSDYVSLRRSILATDVAQQFGQAIGAEVAIVATMNQSPLMEDYIKDPVSNFAIGLVIGGGFGSVFGHIVLRSSMAKELGRLESEAMQGVQHAVAPIPLNINYVDNFQRYVENSNALKALSEDQTTSQLVRDTAAKYSSMFSGLAGEIEKNHIFIGQLAKLEGPVGETTKKLARDIIANPFSFGANTIDLAFFNPNELKNLDALKQGQAMMIRNQVESAAKKGFVGDGGRKDLFTRNEITYKNTPDRYNEGGRIIATDKTGKEVGTLDWNSVTLENGQRINPSVHVEKEYRRQGIASTMYDLAKANGALIPDLSQPGQNRSIEGLAFRQKYDKSKSKVSFTSLSQSINEVVQMAEDSARQRMSLTAKETLKDSPDWATLQKGAGRVFYSPEFKVYAVEQDAKQILHAVDIGMKKAEDIQVGRITSEAADLLGNRGLSSAYSDKRWIDALHTVSKFPLTTGKFFVDENDLPVMQAILSRINQFGNEEKLPKLFITSFGTKMDNQISQDLLRKNAREVTKDELQSYIHSAKEKMIKDLSIQGASGQEISIRTNTPLDTIEKMFATGKTLLESGQTQIYTNTKDIPKYLSHEKQMFQLTTNEHRLKSVVLRNADMSAKLDAKAIEESNKAILDIAMSDSRSEFAKTFYNDLLSQAPEWDMIREGVSRVNNENLGSVMLSSADFFMRRLGVVGEHASVLGQTNVNITNRLSEEQLKGIVAKIRSHVDSQVGNNEFNKIINLLAGLSGWRGIDKNGNLIQRTGFRKELDPVTKKMVDIPMLQPVSDVDGKALFMTDGMKAILADMQQVSREQYELKNTINKILGFKEMEDIGLHIPSFDPRNKFISYVIDREAQLPNERVRLLIGKTAQELIDLEADWNARYAGQRSRYQLVNKSEQEAYNFWQQRVDPIEMDHADITKFHSGSSAQFNIPLDDQYAQTVINNWHNRFIHYGKQLQQIYLSDIMDNLDIMSKINNIGFSKQPINSRIFAANQPKDSALAFKNVLLGNSQLDASETWKATNQTFSNIMDYAIQAIARPSQAFSEAIIEGKYGTKAAWAKANGMTMEEVSWKKFNKELEDSGLGKSPWKSFNEYQAIQNLSDKEKQAFLELDTNFTRFDMPFKTSLKGHGTGPVRVEGINSRQQWNERIAELQRDEMSRRMAIAPAKAEEFIAAGSSFLTMTALKVLETGHAVVNAMSWPIMTLPNLFRDFGKTTLPGGSQVLWPARVMYDGIRYRWSDVGQKKVQQWISEGFAESIVSEVGNLNNLLSTGGKTAPSQIEKIVNSDLVKHLSIATNFSERETRLWSLATGYQAFKSAFPQGTEIEADMFAKAFLTRTVGNYYAGQRPAMFQGSLGVTIGLFQTYMLSWAQNAIRGIEEKNFKALGSMMLSQVGIFGMNSLPLYQQFSHIIGENFSDKHFDLTTGTFRALPDPLAEFLVYGLPASMQIGLYTRGNMQPRLPFVQDNLMDTIAAVNVVHQGYGAMSNMIVNSMNANGFGDRSRAILEGLSTQSLSRPIARMAEMFPMWDSGKQGFEALGSTTREGNTVGTSSMVWSTPGVLSRVLASRSTEEQLKRDMIYLSSYYGALDSQNRKQTTHELKIALRQGDLDSEKLATISERYLRSGTAVGLRSSINEAMSTTEGGVDYTLSRKLRDGSPFNQMIDWGW